MLQLELIEQLKMQDYDHWLIYHQSHQMHKEYKEYHRDQQALEILKIQYEHLLHKDNKQRFQGLDSHL